MDFATGHGGERGQLVKMRRGFWGEEAHRLMQG
jgi:hypothetical protein